MATYLVSPEFTTGNIPTGYTFGENAFKELVYATNATLANPGATVFVYGGNQGADDAVYKNSGEITVSDISYLTGETVSTAVTAYTFENNDGASVTTDGNVSFTILNKLTNAGSFTLGSEASLVAAKEDEEAADIVVENSGDFIVDGGSFTADSVTNTVTDTENPNFFTVSNGGVVNANFTGNGTIKFVAGSTFVGSHITTESNNVIFATYTPAEGSATAVIGITDSTIEAKNLVSNDKVTITNSTITAETANLANGSVAYFRVAGVSTVDFDEMNGTIQLMNGSTLTDSTIGGLIDAEAVAEIKTFNTTAEVNLAGTNNLNATISNNGTMNITGTLNDAKITNKGNKSNPDVGKLFISNADLDVASISSSRGTVSISASTVAVDSISGDTSAIFTVANSTIDAGSVSFSGTCSFTVSGESTLDIGTLSGTITLEDETVLTDSDITGGKVAIGEDFDVTFAGVNSFGTITNAGTITVASDGSNVGFFSATSVSGDIMIDSGVLAGQTGNTYKVVSGLTDNFSVEGNVTGYNNVVFNGSAYIAKNFSDQTTLYVNSAYAGTTQTPLVTGDITDDGNIVGYNAFSNVVDALKKVNSVTNADAVTIKVGSDTEIDNQFMLFQGETKAVAFNKDTTIALKEGVDSATITIDFNGEGAPIPGSDPVAYSDGDNGLMLMAAYDTDFIINEGITIQTAFSNVGTQTEDVGSVYLNWFTGGRPTEDISRAHGTLTVNGNIIAAGDIKFFGAATVTGNLTAGILPDTAENEGWEDVDADDKRLLFLAAGRANANDAEANETAVIGKADDSSVNPEINVAWFDFASGDAEIYNATINAETFIYTNTTGEPATGANINLKEYVNGTATLTATNTQWNVDYFEAYRDLWASGVKGELKFVGGEVNVSAEEGRDTGYANDTDYAAEIANPVTVTLTNDAEFNVLNGTLKNAGTFILGTADNSATQNIDESTTGVLNANKILNSGEIVAENGSINVTTSVENTGSIEITDLNASTISTRNGKLVVTGNLTADSVTSSKPNDSTADAYFIVGADGSESTLNVTTITKDSDIVLAGGATIKDSTVSGGNGRVTTFAGETVTLSGANTFNASAFVIRGTVESDGLTSLTTKKITVNSTGTATLSANTLSLGDLSVSNTLNLSSANKISAGTIALNNATSSITVDGGGELKSKAITNGGTIIVNAGSTISATSIAGGSIILKDIVGMDGVVVSTTGTTGITSTVYYQLGTAEAVEITEEFTSVTIETSQGEKKYVISKTDKTISVAEDVGQSVLYVADTADKLPEGTVLGYNGFTSFIGALAAAQENALPDTTITVLSDITEAPTGNLFATELFDGNVTVNGKLVEDSTTHELRNPIVTVNLGTGNEFDPTPADDYEFIFSAGNSDDETVGIDFVMKSGTFWPNEHPTTPSKATFTISNNVTAQGIVFKKGITNVTSTGTLKATGIPDTTDLGNITFYTDDLVFSVDGEDGGFSVDKPQVTAGGSIIFRKGTVDFDNTFVSAKYLSVSNDYAGEMAGSVNLTSENTTWTVTGNAFVKFYTGSTFDNYTADFTFIGSTLDIAGSFVNVAHKTSNGVDDSGVFEGAPAINLNLTGSTLIAKSVTNDGPGSITVAGESTVKIGSKSGNTVTGGLVGSINVADGAELSATTAIYDLTGDEDVATVKFDAKANGSGITVAADAVIETNIENSNADLKFNGALNTGNGAITNNAGAKITMVNASSDITGASISNSGAIYAKAVTTTGEGGINNKTTTSLISATSITAENGGTIINKGTIGTGQTAPNYGIQLTGDLTATTSTITNGVDIEITEVADKAIIKAANITAANITNYGVIGSQDAQLKHSLETIALTGALTNGKYGNIFADNLEAASIDNINEILVNGITVGTSITNNAGAAIALNSGEGSTGHITIQAGSINNSGYIKTLSGGSITVTGDDALVNGAYEEYEFEESEDKPLALAKGLIWTDSISAGGSITNNGKIVADGVTTATTTGGITTTGSITNNESAVIEASQISADTVTNKGQIETATITTTGSTTSNINNTGTIGSYNEETETMTTVNINAAGTVSNSGTFYAGTLSANRISNTAGTLIVNGDATVTNFVVASGGEVTFNGDLNASSLRTTGAAAVINVNGIVEATSSANSGGIRLAGTLNAFGATLDDNNVFFTEETGVLNVYGESSLKNVTLKSGSGAVNFIGATLTDVTISKEEAFTGDVNIKADEDDEEATTTTFIGNGAFGALSFTVEEGAKFSVNADPTGTKAYTSTFGTLTVEDGAALAINARKSVASVNTPSLTVNDGFTNDGAITVDITGLTWGSAWVPLQVVSVYGEIDCNSNITVTRGEETATDTIAIVINDQDVTSGNNGIYLYKYEGGVVDLTTIVLNTVWGDTAVAPGEPVTFGEDEYVYGINAFQAPTGVVFTSETEQIKFATNSESYGNLTLNTPKKITVWSTDGMTQGGTLVLTNLTVKGDGPSTEEPVPEAKLTSIKADTITVAGITSIEGANVNFDDSKTGTGNKAIVFGAEADEPVIPPVIDEAVLKINNSRVNIGEEDKENRTFVYGNVSIIDADVDFDNRVDVYGNVLVDEESEVEFDRTTTIGGALIVAAGSQVEANQGGVFTTVGGATINGKLYVNTDDDEDIVTGTTASLGTVAGTYNAENDTGIIFTDVNSELSFTAAEGATFITDIDVTGLTAGAGKFFNTNGRELDYFVASGKNADTNINKYFTLAETEGTGYVIGDLIQRDDACNVIKVATTTEIKNAVGGVPTSEYPEGIPAHTWTVGTDTYYADVIEVNVGAGTISKNTYFMANPTMVGGSTGQQIVINSGTFTKPVAAGTKIVPADPDEPETYKGTKEIKLTINGGTFSQHVNGADVVTQEGWVIRKANTYLTINGGTFGVGGGLVAAGMVYATNDVTSLVRLSGDTNLKITGGTFLTTVYGGNMSNYKTGSQCTQITGNANVTIEADWSSENNAKKITMANLILGSSGAGVIKGNTSLTLTGNGDNLSIDSVWGGCGSDTYKKDDNRAYQTSMSATSERILTFEGFINTFDCKSIRGFTKVIVKSFQDDEDEDPIATNATLINTDEYGLADANNWEFELGSSLNGGFANDFAGDTLTLSGIAGIDGMGKGEDWLICSNIDFDKFAFEGIKSINNVTGSDLVFEGNAYTFDFAENQYQLSFGEYTTKGNEQETFNAMYLTRLA